MQRRRMRQTLPYGHHHRIESNSRFSNRRHSASLCPVRTAGAAISAEVGSVLKWLRQLFAKMPMTPKQSASLLNLARSNDEEKTRQILAKTPIRKPTHILAHVVNAKSPKPVKQPTKRGPPPPTPLATVMAHEAANQIRRRTPGQPTAAPAVLANVLKSIEEPVGARKPGAKAQDTVPLARVNVEQEARQLRRVGQTPTASPTAPPVAEWSRKQQMAATGGRPPPSRPDNSGLHAALSKEDAILRTMAARSAAKETRKAGENKKPETALDQVKANQALAIKSKPD